MSTGRIGAWFELMRISNLPTVVSNAIAGGMVGAVAAHGRDATLLEPAAWALAAPPLAYIGGMILNDAFDARIDAHERPSRPIPSGRIARAHAFAAGAACLALAIAAAAATAVAASWIAVAVLCVLVVAYDAFHARTRASVLLLGASRALACLVPMLAFAHASSDAVLALPASRPDILLLPAMLALWTVGLSIAARGEVVTVPADGIWPCVRCGHHLQGSAETCPECGGDNGARARSAWGQRGRMRHMWLLTIGPLLLALAVILVIEAPTATGAVGPTNRLAVLGIGLATGFIATWARIRMAEDRSLTPFAVGVWIACIPLLDAMVLVAVDAWSAALVCGSCTALTLLAQRRIAGS